MKTIDQKVQEIISKKTEELTPNELQLSDLIKEYEKVVSPKSTSYIAAPIDTIGKSVLYNYIKR